MSINGVEPKVTAYVIVEDFREHIENIKIKDSHISTGVPKWELYTKEQIISLLLNYGIEVKND